MSFDLKIQPARAMYGLMAVFMSLSILAQIVIVLSSGEGFGRDPLFVMGVSGFLGAYAMYQLVRKGPPEGPDCG